MPAVLTSRIVRRNASFNPRNSQWERVTALSDAQSWIRESFRKLNEFSRLSENWDGYGSRPIQPAAIQQAASLVEQLSQFVIPAPQIFPVPGGGLQFEWKNAKCEMELEILPDGTMEFLIEDIEGQMREGVISPTYENLSRLILWFNCQRASVIEL